MSKLEKTEISEMEGLEPFLDKEEYYYLIAHIERFLKDQNYKKVGIYLDLEQYQVTQYPSLFRNAREILDLIQNSGLFDQHELDFMTLRSLITLSWPKPKSKQHLELMVKTEAGLHFACIDMAEIIRKRHPDRDAWLPYWARLIHFNLLRDLPVPLQDQFGPDGIPCILIRSRDINAHTFPLTTGNAVAIDYALEPFLKNMNTFMHSYYGSRDMAGPKRIRGAFLGLLPRVLFFKGDLPAYSLPPLSIIFGKDVVLSVKATTDSQISFLAAHEIGHIVLRHPGTRTAFPCDGNKLSNRRVDYLEYEHLHEFEADAFALDWLRSRVINKFRYCLHPKRTRPSNKISKTVESLIEALSEYALFYASVETLFILIGFMELFYECLTLKIPKLSKSKHLKTHPNTEERWTRLQKHCIYDAPLSSDFNMYVKALFADVLKYTETLSSKSIDGLIKEALKNEG